MQKDVIAALLMAVFSSFFMAIVAINIWPLTIQVGQNNLSFLKGFHVPEKGINNIDFRWSNGNAIIDFPRLPLFTPSVITLHIAGNFPSDRPPVRTSVIVNDQLIVSFTLDHNHARFYKIIVPSDLSLAKTSSVNIVSDTFVPSELNPLQGDQRSLGVNLVSISLTPIAPLMPSLWVILWSFGSGLFSYTLFRLIGVPIRKSWIYGLVLVLAVGIVTILRPIEVLLFIQRFTVLFAIACVSLLIVHCTVVLSTGDGHVRGLQGNKMPLILAILWWTLPLFQVFMINDGSNVRLTQSAMWTGSWLLGALLLLCGIAAYVRITRFDARAVLQRFTERAALVLFTIAALAHIIISLGLTFSGKAYDFRTWYSGVSGWLNGSSLYSIEAIEQNHFGMVFKVPPFFAMLFIPFASLNFEHALLVFRITNTIILVATCIIWLRMWNISLSIFDLASVVILFNFHPLLDTIEYGQIDVLLLFLVTLSLWAIRTERDVLAGVFVALGALLKVYPALLLIFFAVKRNWRAMLGFVVGVFVCTIVSVIIIGLDEHVIFVTQVFPRLGGTTSWVENQTIAGFLARFNSSPHSLTIYRDQLVQIISNLAFISILVIVCLAALIPAERRSTLYALQYSLYLLLMVLAIPVAWMHYQTLLLIPFGVLLYHLRARFVSLPYSVLFALSFALIANGSKWSFYYGVVNGILTIAGVSYKFYGMLLLGAILIYEIRLTSSGLFSRYLHQCWNRLLSVRTRIIGVNNQ